MAIKINWKDLQKRIINWVEVEKVMYNWVQIRPESTPPIWDDYLCFTAVTSSSTVKLDKDSGSSPSYTPSFQLEVSTDKENWSDYTIGTTITLSNIWDKVYWRNKSTTQTEFSSPSNINNYWRFYMTWSITAWGDVNYLLCKNSTTTLFPSGEYVFQHLFYQCSSLITPPSLPATTLSIDCYQGMFAESWITTLPQLPAMTLAEGCYADMFSYCNSVTSMVQLPATTLAKSCYYGMFYYCRGLTNIVELPATTLPDYCYYEMFDHTNIELWTASDEPPAWWYSYRIPTSWTATAGNNSLYRMFSNWYGPGIMNKDLYINCPVI